MEKIKLNNGTILEIIPMGIITNEFTKIRNFSFVSAMAYAEIEKLFASAENIANIQYLSESDEILKTYTDCVSMKSLSKETDRLIGEITTEVYTIGLSIDATEKAIQSLQTEITTLKQDKLVLQDTVDALVISGLGV